jgi:hypothetical protein
MPTSVFLSCVSTEFRSYRELLAKQLRTAGVEVYDQDHFRDAGGLLLDHLDSLVQKSEQVVHLIGRGVGSRPKPDELDAFLQRREGLIAKLGLQHNVALVREFSYTQWEFWLARYHNKPCFVYPILGSAEREEDFESTTDQLNEQVAHREQIRKLGHFRHEVADKWELCTRVLVSLMDLSAINDPEPPAIVVGFRSTPEGYSSFGAIRWRGKTVRLADEMILQLSDKEAVCNRLSDLIHRGNAAFAVETLGIDKIVIELVLPDELLTLPLSQWTYYHYQKPEFGKQPIRDWCPIRVRLSGRTPGHGALNSIRNRLRLLATNQATIAEVCRLVPPHEISAENPRPLALVHDGEAEASWHPTAVVCGGLTKPPPKIPRTPVSKGLPKKVIQSEFFRALHTGVPYLVWPEANTPAIEVVDHLKQSPQPSRMCFYFERKPFVVLAESHELPLSDAPLMMSDVKVFP